MKRDDARFSGYCWFGMLGNFIVFGFCFHSFAIGGAAAFAFMSIYTLLGVVLVKHLEKIEESHCLILAAMSITLDQNKKKL